MFLKKRNTTDEGKTIINRNIYLARTKHFQKKTLLIEHLNTQRGKCIKENLLNISNVSGFITI